LPEHHRPSGKADCVHIWTMVCSEIARFEGDPVPKCLSNHDDNREDVHPAGIFVIYFLLSLSAWQRYSNCHAGVKSGIW